jgi:hypothetical protein
LRKHIVFVKKQHPHGKNGNGQQVFVAEDSGEKGQQFHDR